MAQSVIDECVRNYDGATLTDFTSSFSEILEGKKLRFDVAEVSGMVKYNLSGLCTKG